MVQLVAMITSLFTNKNDLIQSLSDNRKNGNYMNSVCRSLSNMSDSKRALI